MPRQKKEVQAAAQAGAMLDFADITLRRGILQPTDIYYPKEKLTDQAVSPAAGIQATKLVHQHALRFVIPAGTVVAAATNPLHIFRDAGTIIAIDVSPIVAPVGGDLAYTIDLQAGNEATPFATVLSAVVTIDSTVSNREVVSGVVSVASDDRVDGDILQVVIATSGTTGTQGSGLIVTVWIRENP